jgi:hypothetical protein
MIRFQIAHGRVAGSKVPEVPEVRRFGGSEVQRFRGSEVQRFRGSEVQSASELRNAEP